MVPRQVVIHAKHIRWTGVVEERYLDERVENYPDEPIGSNYIDSYVDVCAARVLPEPITGIGALLKEAWSRYGAPPIAITEVHKRGAHGEEQLRLGSMKSGITRPGLAETVSMYGPSRSGRY